MKTKKNQKGFSFIEAIISVFLLAVGMVAILNLISSGFSETIAARDQQIAVLLSQEGTELVRNVRDTNWLKGNDSFDSNFFPAGNNDCTINYEDNILICPAVSFKLKLDGSGYYTHNGTVDTKFYRKISVNYDNPSDPGYADVTSLVWWGSASEPSDTGDCTTANNCVFAETTLSKWGE